MNMFPSSSEQTSNIKTKNMGKGEEYSSSRSVSSCLLSESCVLHVPVGTIWEELKSFKFDKIAPSIMSSIKFLSGKPNEIGSTYQVEYKDKSRVAYMITELSEIKRSFTIDMIECDPKQSFSSMLTTIKLCRVTQDDSTFLCWKALFSNDITPEALKCKRERVEQLFREFKKYFEKTEKKF